MFLSVFSSWSTNACIWLGSVILIAASVSVSFISRAALMSAIFASLTFVGMPVCTRSLSITRPRTSSVLSVDAPCFFSSLMLSRSITTLLFSVSDTAITASTAIFARKSFAASAFLPVIAVIATSLRTSVSFSVTGVAILSSAARQVSFAKRNPCTIIVGCMFWSMSASDSFSRVPARTAAVVVPSPTSSSCVFATSTIILAAGCWISISSRIVTPSFVITTSPIESVSILSIPRGPSVVLIASATAFAAAMFCFCALFPCSRSAPSGNMYIGCPPYCCPFIKHTSIVIRNISRTRYL